MSYALTYPEPNRLPAGLLALAVHFVFFALLMFGLRWQSQPPEEYSVELWQALPSDEVVREPVLTPPPAPPAPTVKAAPPQAVKADIELREKKISKKEPAKPSAKESRARRLAEEQRLLQEYVEQRRQAERSRVRAEVSAATAAEVGRFQDMIRSKVRRNIVMPPDVPESAVAEFKVTMLPGGAVMDVELVKSSGNVAYDNAAERAIYKSDPLPMPTDAELQKMFRVLTLKISP